jgi:hypothetical protein
MSRPAATRAVLLAALVLRRAAATSSAGRWTSPAAGFVPVVAMKNTGVVPGSVTASRAPDGKILVSWKTKTPTSGGHVLAATLHFENRPLYGDSLGELPVAPSIDHSATLDGLAPGAAVKFGIATGQDELTDNGVGFDVVGDDDMTYHAHPDHPSGPRAHLPGPAGRPSIAVVRLQPHRRDGEPPPRPRRPTGSRTTPSSTSVPLRRRASLRLSDQDLA